MFRAERVGELLWPEVAVVGGLIATTWLLTSVDAIFGLTKPFRRLTDYGHVAALGGSAYLYATGRAPEITRTLFLTDMALVGKAVGDLAFQRIAAPTVRAIASRRQVAAGQSAAKLIAEGKGIPVGSAQRAAAPYEV